MRRPGHYPIIRLAGESRVTLTKGSFQFGIDRAAFAWTALWILISELKLSPSRTPATPASSSYPLLLTLKHGIPGSDLPLVCNPQFLETLMGWPTGWTDTDSSVTEFAAWLRRSRSALSMLNLLRLQEAADEADGLQSS